MKRILTSLLLLSLAAACAPRHDDDVVKLMALHEAQRTAHFSKDAKLMSTMGTADLLSVNHGRIDSRSAADQEARFKRYFSAVEFKKWDDLQPPRIRLSDDHSMAYMIVDKLVVLDAADSAGNTLEETTHFAWVAICRKQPDGEWKIECVASTNEPEAVK